MKLVNVYPQIIRINKYRGCSYMVYADFEYIIGSIKSVAKQASYFHTKKDATAFILSNK